MPGNEVAKLGDVRIVPGMPVEAFVQTGDRTVISYLVKPLARSIDADVPGKMTGTRSRPQAASTAPNEMAFALGAAVRTSARALRPGAAGCAAALRITDPLPLEELRLRAFDLFQVMKPRVATQRPVVIVDIDEESLKSIGQWPWPRTRVADLITRLTQIGALAIAFDVVFAEPDRLSPALRQMCFAISTRRRAPSCAPCRATTRSWPTHCADRTWSLGETGLPFAVPQPEGTQPPVGIATLGGDPKPFLLNFPGLLRNVPILEQAASGRGLFTIRAERDGIVRRVPIVMQAQGTIMPSLTSRDAAGGDGSNTILISSDHAGIKSVPCPASRCRPTATASSGFISRRTTRRATCRPPMCSKAASRPTALPAGLC